MERETHKYAGRTWGRYPEAENRTDRCYYKTTIDGRAAYLHRYIWEERFGPIPEGLVVHHIDGDTLNNSLVNFALLTQSEHSKRHPYTEERLERARQNLDEIRHRASAWHGSEEGRTWHSANGKLAWAQREAIQLQCEQCGTTYATKALHGNTRFCSNNCKSQWRREQGIDDEWRICPQCEEAFVCNKYSRAQCCSRKCAGRRRTAMRKASVQS